jgi:hypothetical protein
MSFDRTKVLAVLKAINERVLAKHGNPTKDEEAYPTIKRVFTEAAPQVPGIQAVLDSGMLDKITAVTDDTKAKAIEEDLTNEIKDAIRRGELPHPDSDPFMKKWKKRKKK